MEAIVGVPPLLFVVPLWWGEASWGWLHCPPPPLFCVEGASIEASMGRTLVGMGA